MKDKKYNRKLHNLLTKFLAKMKFSKAETKIRPKRTFPETQKDIDLVNIKEIKRIQAEKDADRKKRKKQIVEE